MMVNVAQIKERFISKNNKVKHTNIPLSKGLCLEKHRLSISNCVTVSLINDVYIIK